MAWTLIEQLQGGCHPIALWGRGAIKGWGDPIGGWGTLWRLWGAIGGWVAL